MSAPRALPAEVEIEPRPQRSPWSLWLACCRGEKPAELLDPRDREDLLLQLHLRGWTDREIAVHCRMSTYTAARILDRLGLEPNTTTSESRRSADAA